MYGELYRSIYSRKAKQTRVFIVYYMGWVRGKGRFMCEASRQRRDRQNDRRIIMEATRRWVQNGVRG